MKKISISFVVLFLSCSIFACQTAPEKELSETKEQDFSNSNKAYFASGCFWCVEAIFESVKGVEEVVSGYAGGEKANPTYQEVSRGATQHAEAVMVIYDPSKIDFNELLKVFFASHDPTTMNRQGPDRGPQYRSIAFYQTEEQKRQIELMIEELEQKKEYNSPIVTQLVAFDKFWKAEAYHQDFEHRNPDHPYIRQVSVPRLERFQSKMPEILK